GNDRRYRSVDEHGTIAKGKRFAAIHGIRAQCDLASSTVSLSTNDSEAAAFSLVDEHEGIAKWLSDYFGFRVQLEEDSTAGFPDDPDACGPTLVSTASLAAIADWFPPLDVDEMRRRLRPNLEI